MEIGHQEHQCSGLRCCSRGNLTGIIHISDAVNPILWNIVYIAQHDEAAMPPKGENGSGSMLPSGGRMLHCVPQ